MQDRRPVELEMNLQGEFVSPPRPSLLNRVMIWAIAIAVLAGSLTIAALALWLALIILPVALGAAVIAYGIWRYQMWRRRSAFNRRQVMRR
jgi:hypothetical protein